MISYGYSILGSEIIRYGDQIFDRRVKNRYSQDIKFSASLLAVALRIDDSEISNYLNKDKNGYPIRRISLFNLVRIIVAIRADSETAYRWINIAGYSIDSNYIPDNTIYRKIVATACNASLDELNTMLESIDDTRVKNKTVFSQI